MRNQKFLITLIAIIVGVILRLTAYINDWASVSVIVIPVVVYLIVQGQCERHVKPEIEVNYEMDKKHI